MPFISRNERQFVENRLRPHEIVDDSFGATVGAMGGLMIDEELSISSELNNEIYHTRREITKKLFNDGVIYRNQYRVGLTGIDYDKISQDLVGTEYEGMVYTNEEAKSIRNQILANRRKEREKIIDRGSGFAQFVGAAGALMLDPINTIGLGAGLALSTTRGATVLGRALYTARNEAAIGAVAETAIQPFVFAHKQDIDSPYSAEQALANIGVATAFAGGIGAVAGGVSGYLYKARTRGREAYINALPDDFKVDVEFKETVDGVETTRSITVTKENLQTLVNTFRELSAELTSATIAKNEFVQELYDQFSIGKIDSVELNRLIREGDPVKAYQVIKEKVDTIEQVLDTTAGATGGGNLKKSLESLKEAQKMIDDVRLEYADDPLIGFEERYQKAIDENIDLKAGGREEFIRNEIRINEALIKRIQREGTTLNAWLISKGGLNLEDFASELGRSTKELTKAPGVSGQVFVKGKGLTVDGLREALREDPTLAYEFGFNPFGPDEQIDLSPWLDMYLSNPKALADPQLQTKVESIQEIITRLEDRDPRGEVVEELFQEAQGRRAEIDNRAMYEMLRREEEFETRHLTPEDFEPANPELQDLPETNIQITGSERQILNEQGLSESHDQIMARYETLSDEDKLIPIEPDSDRTAKDVIEQLDKELELIDNLVRCTRGA